MSIPRFLAGVARQFTYDSSGNTVNSLTARLYAGVGSGMTMVASYTASESGSGLGNYYVNILLPNTAGFYTMAWVGAAGTYAAPGGGTAYWQARYPFQLTMEEVD